MGVWIETTEALVYVGSLEVTPFVGVWIETILALSLMLSLPVTPFVGVWIETKKDAIKKFNHRKSHPSWVCGLKQFSIKLFLTILKSHPSWVCGLKPLGAVIIVPTSSHTLRGCVD